MLSLRSVSTVQRPDFVVPAASHKTVTSPACVGRLLMTEHQFSLQDCSCKTITQTTSRRTCSAYFEVSTRASSPGPAIPRSMGREGAGGRRRASAAGVRIYPLLQP